MFKVSRPLEDEPDNNVNGYSPEEEEMTQEDKDLIDEIDKLLDEYEKSFDQLENDILETYELVDDEKEEIENIDIENMEGSGILDLTVIKPSENAPNILWSFYNILIHYQERRRDIDDKINELIKDKQSIKKMEFDIKKLMSRTLSPSLISEQQRQLQLIEEKFFILYNKIDELQTYGQTAYNNLFSELNEKYKKLKNRIDNEEIKEDYVYSKRRIDDINSQLTDVLDLLEIIDTKKLNEISDEGTKARTLYYQMILSKNDEDHSNISKDPIQREDGTRNEVLFKKYFLSNDKKYKDKPLVGFDQSTFFNKIDFERKNEIIELKTSYENPGKWLYIDKNKIQTLLDEEEYSGRKPRVFWYYSPSKGYLTNKNTDAFNEISQDDYNERIYTLKKLDKNTFRKSDIDSKKPKSYRIRIDDERITL
jgi:hypothetical protein